MAKPLLNDIVRHCDQLLRTSEVNDYPGAVNGLQVENRGRVSRIAAAVDASHATVRKAIDLGADLLVVHHGLFWSARHPWTGRNYELLRLLIDNDVAVYSSHLPLDMHPKLGNNILLSRALGLRNARPFFFDKEQHLGVQAREKISRAALASKLASVLGAEPLVIPGGPDVCQRIGIVTGGAGDELKRAAAEGVDTFITGEGRHWTFALAEELGLNVFYGGHYATETFGVKALSQHLSAKYKVPWSFIDHPTGL
jgi:dinuclear metal center YbgI/SA1388 family protein